MISLVLCATVLAGGSRAAEPAALPKTLSADDVRAYLAGEGMGLARAAELNGHPGPKHVLELASQLGLTPAQQAATENVFASMHRQAVALGREVVAREGELDALFAAVDVDEAALERTLDEIGRLQARLRGVHLRAHLETRHLLTSEQVSAYDRLRGHRRGGHDAHGSSAGVRDDDPGGEERGRP